MLLIASTFLILCDPIQEMTERLGAKSAEKEALVTLLADLVAKLPPDSKEKESLQTQVDDVTKKWSALSENLSQHESNLEAAFMLAKGREGAMAKLFPWVPGTLERLENLGPPPAEPELVEKLKAEIEVCAAVFMSKGLVFRMTCWISPEWRLCL